MAKLGHTILSISDLDQSVKLFVEAFDITIIHSAKRELT